MGSDFSQPLPPNDRSDYVCIVLRESSKARLINAPNDVQSMVANVVMELSGISQISEDKCGSVQFKLPGSPFVTNSGSDSATVGKLFGIKVLSGMHSLGYDTIMSSDLSRLHDQSTWFFQKKAVERPRKTVCCVAPGGTDKLILVRCNDQIVSTIKGAIQNVWSRGIQDESTEESRGETLIKFKLNGTPWHGQGQESTECRKLLMDIISRMSALRWKFLLAGNIKGGTDSLFFLHEPEEFNILQKQFAMLSLNRDDRLRLINFGSEMNEPTKMVIISSFQPAHPSEEDYYGAHEFKLKGSPFCCSGNEAVATKKLLCKLLELFAARGWFCLSSLDVSRKVTDKSVLIFQRGDPSQTKVGCIALSDVAHMRFINFPNNVTETLAKSAQQFFLPGFALERTKISEDCYKMYMNGSPWGERSGYGLHGRHMIMNLVRVLSGLGWTLATSADTSAKYVHQENGPDYPVDVDSMFFYKVDQTTKPPEYL